jgi:hypothetical protein
LLVVVLEVALPLGVVVVVALAVCEQTLLR